MAITPTRYNELREKLLGILTEAADYQELNSETRGKFERAVEKLQTESFEIVLVGEFQGGKSTTFNAICDGREISPMGIGIKTSACRVSARNIADPNEAERAVVSWKSDAELILTMFDILERNLPEAERERFAQAKDRDFEGISFDNPNDMRLMRACVEREWEVYQKRPAAYDRDQTGKLDLLYIASLILEFRNNPTIVRERAETREISVEALKTYVVFPIDWAQRWEARDPKAFTAEEVRLVFVGRVDCYLHSPNLARLGCVVVDCPGLFAGPWDTRVAIDAMISADAILYLLRGDKAIGQQELRALTEIQKSKQLHKLFFAINARASAEHLREKIRPVDAATINNNFASVEGEESPFKVESEEIFIFNAFLSYCAKSRDGLEPGGADEKAWKKKARNALGVYWDLDVEDDAETMRALLSNPTELLRASDYETLTDVCETTVVKKKARSLLLDSGAVPVNAALSELEGELALKEENARKGAEQVRAELRKARETLDEFQRRSKAIVEQELNDATILTTLAENMVTEVYEQNTDLMADAMMRRVEEILNNGGSQFEYICDFVQRRWNGDSVGNDKLAQKLKGCVKETMDEVCKPAAQGWLDNVAKGTNRVYQATLGQKMRAIELLLRQEWNEMMINAGSEAKAYLKGLELDGVSQTTTRSVADDFDGGDGLVGSVRSAMFQQFATDIGAAVAASIAASIAAALAFVVLAPFAAPLGVVGALAATVAGAKAVEWGYAKISEKINAALASKLAPELRKTLQKPEVRAGLLALGEETARKIVALHRKALQRDLNAQQQKFDARVASLEAQNNQSIAEKEAIAKEAKRVRQKIAVLRRPLEEFVNEAKTSFAE